MIASAAVAAVDESRGLVDETLTDDAIGRRRGEILETAGPHVFIALECSRPSSGVTRHSLANIDRVTVGRGRERTFARSLEGGVRTLELRIPDVHLSSRHACFTRSGGGFLLEDCGSRNGTRIGDALVTEPTSLGDGDFVLVGRTVMRFRSEFSVPFGDPADVDSNHDDGAAAPLASIVPAICRRGAALARVARSDSSVLLVGETGTGKEVLARAIHRLSGRDGRFVAVNCGAIPSTLVEAQLFGYLRGAFSGAAESAPGLFRSADRGTLLLDEVAELPGAAQAALLRVLQEREVLPIGSAQPVKVDFRVIAATHRPLDALVAQGSFRKDLFARLSAFTFEIPPLRERSEDIGILIGAFTKAHLLTLTPAAGTALLGHDWPHNVRELHQVLGVAAALANKEPLDVSHLPDGITRASNHKRRRPSDPELPDPLREVLTASLSRHAGNVSAVARDLGKARMQVQRWIRRFGIDPSTFRVD